MPRPTPRRRALLLALALPLCLAACWARIPGAQSGDEVVIHMPIRSAGPGSLDPVRGSTTYDNQASSLLYETLLQYRYLKRPLELEPLLLTEMPSRSEDGLIWSFELRDDVFFHDNECFVTDDNPEGKGRKLVAADVIYSWKRIADSSIDTKNWWLVENTIAGFDDWRDERNLQRDVHERKRSKAWYKALAALYAQPTAERPDDWRARVDALFIDPADLRSEEWYARLQTFHDVPAEKRDRDWEADLSEFLNDAPRDEDLDATFDFYAGDVPGMRVTGEHTFEVELTEPVASFQYKLAMFQLSVVPREAVEHYGWRFSRNPVGTGPFLLEDWQTSLSMDFVKNPNYHEDRYPSDPEDQRDPQDVARGLHRDAGKLLPLADRVRIHCYVQDQPMWLDFRAGVLDYAQIPAENFEDAVNKRTKALTKEYADEGYTYLPVPLLDFIFRGFNCDESTSEVLGGYSERAKNLRRAISLALDLEEFNDTFYNSQNIVYDGMIPPSLDGHPEGHKCDAAYRGPDLTRARQLLVEAGYPNGEGLPKFDYYTSLAANSQEQSEMMRRQLAEIGVEINPILLEFPQLIAAIDERRAPIFSFAWGSDYPDGENNLALFYGPNESPGSNHYNYGNPAYDELYERIRTMEPSPERTVLYERMRDMVLDDAAYVGSMARTRNYLGTERLENFKPSEDFWNWPKYLTIASDPAGTN